MPRFHNHRHSNEQRASAHRVRPSAQALHACPRLVHSEPVQDGKDHRAAPTKGLNYRKAQVAGSVTWASSEPPKGIEPLIYALRAHRRSCSDTRLVLDGALVLSRDNTVAEQSKNYRYSTSQRVVIGAGARRVVAVGRPVPGSRNDCTPTRAWPDRTANLERGTPCLPPQNPPSHRARLLPHEDSLDTDHPPGAGSTRRGFPGCPSPRGPSPRALGAHGDQLGDAVLLGTIPAGAGSTPD